MQQILKASWLGIHFQILKPDQKYTSKHTWLSLVCIPKNWNVMAYNIIFRVTDPLRREFAGHRWIRLTQASDVGFRCFLWSAPEKNGWVNNRDAGDLRSHITLTMTSLECWLVTHLQLSPFNGWYHICIANTLDATETVRISPNGIMMTSWMETFSALLAICAENSAVPGEFPTQRQWRGALMFSLICVWINGWINNREAGDLRRNHAHYDVIVMNEGFSNSKFIEKLSVLLQMVSICIQHHNILCGVYRIRSVTTWNRDDTLYI